MPNQFEVQGSQNPEKPHRAVPLATTKLFTGYWPNSAPYRDAAVQYLYEKFYGASRNDKIAAGLNTEISPRMTLVRRPGSTVWNSNSFTNVTGFYSFRPFVPEFGEHVYVIVDEPGAVYIGSADGTPMKSLLYTKAASAQKSRFKGEGNTLYWGDTANTTKWTWAPAWEASKAYPSGALVLNGLPGNPDGYAAWDPDVSYVAGNGVSVDGVGYVALQSSTGVVPGSAPDGGLFWSARGSLQQNLGYGLGVVSTSVTSNIATITFSGTGSVAVGDVVTFQGLTTKTGFNNASVPVLSISGSTFTVSYTASNYGTTADTGVVIDLTKTSGGVSGSSAPAFTGAIQGVILDGTTVWECWGPSVQNMGIVAPTAAPVLAITPSPAAAVWAASTYYWPQPLIVDSNGGGPYVWGLTTSGTTNSSVPSGLTTGSPTPRFSAGTISASPTTVTDGTAVWTCNSLATRGTGTIYSIGQVIFVSWTYVYYTYTYTSGGTGSHPFTGCFSGSARVKTPDGPVRFEDMGDGWLPILNEHGGTSLARRIKHENWHEAMIDLGGGELVTMGHLIKGPDGKYVPAVKVLPGNPLVEYTGTVYDMQVLDEDHVYLLECGIVAHNKNVIDQGDPSDPGTGSTQVPHNVTYMGFFACVQAGTSSSTATASLAWAPALGGTVNDGTVVWKNVGQEVTRLAATTVGPTGGGQSNMVAGNVNNSTLVSATTIIADANSNGEIPIIAGLSAGTAPTWAAAQGAQTIDNSSITWLNQGPLGKANTGVWFYSFTYVNAATGDESSGSPLSAPILLPASSAVLITGPGSPDLQVGLINIYRSTQQPTGSVSGTPFRLTSIQAPVAGQSWTFTDTTPDPPVPGAILNVFLLCPSYAVVNGVVTNRNDPPPAGLTNLEFHAGRMWGTVGNISYYSTGPDTTSGNGITSWNILNFNETPGTMHKLWPTTVGLFHFTNDGAWLVQGLGTPTSPFQKIQLVDQDLSLSSYDSFCLNGTQALIYTTDRLYFQIDPQQGTSWLGEPVATDLLAGFAPGNVYLTHHSNGLDQIGVITDGSTSWRTWKQVPAPETGYLWNPPATIAAGAGGMGAVASIETSPGISTLLIGPSGTGPILARDSAFATFTDNSNAYSAWAAFGNIVFAHHGQMAGLIHVGADYIRKGSVPVLSVLLDEILGQAATPPWVPVPNPINDPPNLVPSKTLFQLRYWLIETQQPIYCRNALFKFDFGTDTVQNELLTFTIFGESLTEETQT